MSACGCTRRRGMRSSRHVVCGRRDPTSETGEFLPNRKLDDFFIKGGWEKQQKKVEATPKDRLRLLLALQQLHWERRARC